MTRPLRLEFAGAIYHVTARGDRQEAIFVADADRLVWINLLGDVCARYNFVVHSFCQMTNHYHLVLETLDGNLSRGMRHLNGVYSQYFNRRYGLVGHLFQGRYHAVLVQKDRHLLELARYVVLNPVRAKMVSSPEMWPWSSHRLIGAQLPPPDWLDADWLLAQFGEQRAEAVAAYRRFVQDGTGLENPFKKIRHQTLLGSAEFIEQFQRIRPPEPMRDITRTQRRILALPLDGYQINYPDRDEAITRAYLSTAYTMSQIARHFGVSLATVSRAIKAHS